jgi:hypothetical protein
VPERNRFPVVSVHDPGAFFKLDCKLSVEFGFGYFFPVGAPMNSVEMYYGQAGERRKLKRGLARRGAAEDENSLHNLNLLDPGEGRGRAPDLSRSG